MRQGGHVTLRLRPQKDGLDTPWRKSARPETLGAMSGQRPRREHPSGATAARSGATEWVLTLWIVAAFLGALVASHYVLHRLLVGGSEAASAISSGWVLL